MAATVTDVVRVLDKLVPPTLAEDWDNIGLQVGDPNWPVQTIWVSLDPTPQVVKAACQKNVDLLVSHHPLIFKPLKSINFGSSLGSIIALATRHHLSIFAAHTNLDSVTGGINDILARRIGLKALRPLAAASDEKRYKLVVYAPDALAHTVSSLLVQTLPVSREQGSFCASGTTAFMAQNEGLPENKTSDRVAQINKIRFEIEVGNNEIAKVLEVVAGHHLDEQVHFDVYPLFSHERRHGMGRIGCLDKVMELKAFAMMIKKKLNLKVLKFAGDPSLPVQEAAVCSGSGSGLLSNFFASGAQAYVSGDLRYHDAREAETANLGIIDIGHFPSEHLIIGELSQRMKQLLAEFHLDITVKACDLENDPFEVL
jgi:dinuclear metal center YbgI/SA1388 family protein